MEHFATAGEDSDREGTTEGSSRSGSPFPVEDLADGKPALDLSGLSLPQGIEKVIQEHDAVVLQSGEDLFIHALKHGHHGFKHMPRYACNPAMYFNVPMLFPLQMCAHACHISRLVSSFFQPSCQSVCFVLCHI